MSAVARTEANKPFKVASDKTSSQYARLYGDNYKRLLTSINGKQEQSSMNR